MASLAKVKKARQRMKLRKAGRKRKNKLSQRSTLSYTELFAACGEPGQPKSADQ